MPSVQKEVKIATSDVVEIERKLVHHIDDCPACAAEWCVFNQKVPVVRDWFVSLIGI